MQKKQIKKKKLPEAPKPPAKRIIKEDLEFKFIKKIIKFFKRGE